MSEAVHGTGESYVRGTRNSCAGCHSGGAFSKMIAAGLAPNAVEAGDPNPPYTKALLEASIAALQ